MDNCANRFNYYLTKPLEYGIQYGMTDNDMFHTAATDAASIVQLIREYCEAHPSALPGGSDWLLQDDQGQADAIILVGKILNQLQWYGK